MVSMLGGRLLLDDLDHFASFILAAVRAYPVRQFRLVAIRTLRHAWMLQRIVCAAVTGAPL